MTNVETHVLIFKDQTGEYYLLPREVLERGRLPAEEKAELERQLAGSDDVAGHTPINPRLQVAAAYISVGAMFIGEGAQKGEARLRVFTRSCQGSPSWRKESRSAPGESASPRPPEQSPNTAHAWSDGPTHRNRRHSP